MNPLSYTSDIFAKELYGACSRGYEQALDLYSWYIRKGFITQVPSLKNASELYKEMTSLLDLSSDKVSFSVQDEEAIRFLLSLKEGSIESVILFMKKKNTLCVSSQIGCKRGCRFCTTGKMGFLRDLLPFEIVEQLFIAQHVFKVPIQNVVFMGMGEPFDNIESVKQAVSIFLDPLGFSLGLKNITISTSGHVSGIRKMADDFPRVNLALSLHAASDEKRRFLMPSHPKGGLQEILEACRYYVSKTQKEILVAYIMIQDINDKEEDAESLIQYLQGLPVKVNLIPYNEEGSFSPSSDERIDFFMRYLRERGISVLLRRSKGTKISASCGLLANKGKYLHFKETSHS